MTRIIHTRKAKERTRKTQKIALDRKNITVAQYANMFNISLKKSEKILAAVDFQLMDAVEKKVGFEAPVANISGKKTERVGTENIHISNKYTQTDEGEEDFISVTKYIPKIDKSTQTDEGEDDDLDKFLGELYRADLPDVELNKIIKQLYSIEID